jgi:uncharacterized membrane protein
LLQKREIAMYSSRSLDLAALMSAALLLSACQAEPAANVADENAADPEGVTTAPANAAAPFDTPPAAEPKARYRFTGTEPFWGGTIDGAKILYKTPEDQAGTTVMATMSKQGTATRYSGSLDGQPFILTLNPGPCSDGMSDTVYPLSATLAVHGEQRNGCANPLVGTK